MRRIFTARREKMGITLCTICLLLIIAVFIGSKAAPAEESVEEIIAVPVDNSMQDPIKVKGDGSLYEFHVTFPQGINKISGQWVYSNDGWAYTVTRWEYPANLGVFNSDSYQPGMPWKMLKWWTPPTNATATIIVHGLKFPWGGTGGGGGGPIPWSSQRTTHVNLSVDMDIIGVPDDKEADDGVCISAEETAPTQQLTLRLKAVGLKEGDEDSFDVREALHGSVRLELDNNNGNVVLLDSGGTPIGQLPQPNIFNFDLQGNQTLILYVRGAIPTGNGPVILRAVYTPQGAAELPPDTGKVTVFEVKINPAVSMYLVPGSDNHLKYDIAPEGFTADAMLLTVTDKYLNEVLSRTDLARTGSEDFLWNAMDGETPLTTENGPYALSVEVRKNVNQIEQVSDDILGDLNVIQVDDIEKVALNTNNADPPAPKFVIKENGDFYIANNTAMRFTAISTTPDVWPPDMPVWGGAVNGTGPVKEAILSTDNTTSVVRREITATCGNTKSTEVIIDNVKPAMSWYGATPGNGQYFDWQQSILIKVWAHDNSTADGVGLKTVKFYAERKDGQERYSGQLNEVATNLWEVEFSHIIDIVEGVFRSAGEYTIIVEAEDLLGNTSRIQRDVYIVQINIITPVEDHKISFGTGNPGYAYIGCQASVIPASLASSVIWTISGLSTPTTWQYVNNQLVLSHLPSQNSGFGAKTVKVRINDSIFATVNIRLFFPNQGSNNPAGNVPNWYYYWKRTTANYASHAYDAVYDDACGYCAFINGAWSNRITKYGNATFFSGNQGIDCFAQVCRHEERHRLDLSEFWGNNDRIPSQDTDDDLIPDSREAALGYNPAMKATHLDTYNYGDKWCDIEHYCITRCYNWTDGSADTQDWSDPGKQSN